MDTITRYTNWLQRQASAQVETEKTGELLLQNILLSNCPKHVADAAFKKIMDTSPGQRTSVAQEVFEAYGISTAIFDSSQASTRAMAAFLNKK